jgi:hypothetical protein
MTLEIFRILEVRLIDLEKKGGVTIIKKYRIRVWDSMSARTTKNETFCIMYKA